MRLIIVAGLMGLLCAGAASQSVSSNSAALDSDHDGLADGQEQELLERFAPTFMISRTDCSSQPAEFEPSVLKPVVAAENDTIYGQAFPRAAHAGEVELHYYDLWRKDCGQQGHPLDAEHVSVLVAPDKSGMWKARYWYAAAHEDTLCDASQVARAGALGAELHGPAVWISSGKHAAFLGHDVCSHGCGADNCGDDQPVAVRSIVNLGEAAAPMNGATWSASAEWPLANKMRRSDFSDSRLEQVDRLPKDEIAWANPAKRRAQSAIYGGDAALGGAATGFRATGSALTVADTSYSGAMDKATNKTGNALARTFRGVLKTLGGAARSTAGDKK